MQLLSNLLSSTTSNYIIFGLAPPSTAHDTSHKK